MLRRGALGAVVVVGGLRPANDVAEEHGDEGGVGGGRGGHVPMVRPGLASCTHSRSAERLQSLADDRDRDLRQALRAEGHTVDSLAVTLGCARSIAGDLLAGRRRWTDHQRAKLAKGAA